MIQADERQQSTDAINSTFPKQSIYTGNHMGLMLWFKKTKLT